MAAGGDLYCPRCDDSVGVLREWSGWKWCWRAWVAGACVMLAATPLLAYDFCVIIPSMMLYLVAGSSLRMLARQRPVCRRCSFELTEGCLSGEPLQRKPPTKAVT
ncbi:MAG: hypothetical protein RLO52_20245 [Sandaracinaceae bacterium]|nr:MAG: hypothetical protein EVA89_33310 [Sandaracinaceae bacterium]